MIRMGPNAGGNHNSDPPKNGDGKGQQPFYNSDAFLKEYERRRAQPPTIPKPKEMPASEALTFLKSMGTGWDAELERLLDVPDKLFSLQTGPYLQYCSTEAMDMGAIFRGLRAGGRSFSTGMEYGFMVYDSASATHFLFFDARRRMVVRGIVQEYGEEGGQSWAGIKKAIEVALKRAETSAAAGNSLIAVCDREIGHSSMARLETVH